MNINARGTFLCYKYAAEQMIKQGASRGGRIIGAASSWGKRGGQSLILNRNIHDADSLHDQAVKRLWLIQCRSSL